jgi:hypothetical protein
MYQFNGNDFTMPEPTTRKVTPQSIPAGYQKVAENRHLALYMSKTTLGLAVRDKRSGYVWTSVPPSSALKKEQLNSDWSAAVQSPVVVSYFDPDSTPHQGSFGTLEGNVADFQPIQDGVRAVMNLDSINVSITVEVKLDGDGLVVRIPNSGIVERGEERLSALRIYPFFGAVHDADIPGYMLIPDGSGALIRYRDHHPNYDQPFVGNIYGEDMTLKQNPNTEGDIETSLPPQPILMPVFGVVHGTGQNAFLGIVEAGQYDASILAYPSGVTTNLNWVTPEFAIRHSYFQPTSRSGDGFNTFQKTRNHQDFQIRYEMLTGTDADYVGMANAYRTYLLEKGLLKKNIAPSSDVPVQIDLLGEEMKPGLIGTSFVSMTTFQQAESIVRQLQKNHVRNIQLVYKGWNKDGLTASNPDMVDVADGLGGLTGLKTLKKDLDRLGVKLYLYSDFSSAFHSSNGFTIKTQAVRDITNQIIKDNAVDALEQMNNRRFRDLSMYYINPGVAKNIADNAADVWKSWGISGTAVDKTGKLLFSDFNPRRPFTRMQSAQSYRALANNLVNHIGNLAMYTPNDYLFKYVQSAYNLPLSSSQYMYESDSVPFLQMVLHGMVNGFAPYENFNAEGREEILRMIDYGIYPSFYITNEPSWKLKDTPSETLFTSRFQDWSGDIQAEYKDVNEALKWVQDAHIIKRVVPDWGLVKDVYSNGYTIFINYRSSSAVVDGVQVPAQGYVVKKGGQNQ